GRGEPRPPADPARSGPGMVAGGGATRPACEAGPPCSCHPRPLAGGAGGSNTAGNAVAAPVFSRFASLTLPGRRLAEAGPAFGARNRVTASGGSSAPHPDEGGAMSGAEPGPPWRSVPATTPALAFPGPPPN